jgi:RNA polymerase sigma-70 factor (ECF subfamily)
MADTIIQLCIDRLNAGDVSARNELLVHARARLNGLAHKMLYSFSTVKPWEQTDDVLQNALVRLDRALQVVPFTTVMEFICLATTQIRRELLDLARHYGGPRGFAANQVPPGQPSGGDKDSSSDGGAAAIQRMATASHDPSQLADWTEFHQQVEALPPEDREVFNLRWYLGMNQSEAAAVLGVSHATIRKRWLAARLRLQEFLANGSPTGNPPT